MLLLAVCMFGFVAELLVACMASLNTEGVVKSGVGQAWPSTRSGGLEVLGAWSCWPMSLGLGIES